jgi:hypothetical protein
MFAVVLLGTCGPETVGRLKIADWVQVLIAGLYAAILVVMLKTLELQRADGVARGEETERALKLAQQSAQASADGAEQMKELVVLHRELVRIQMTATQAQQATAEAESRERAAPRRRAALEALAHVKGIEQILSKPRDAEWASLVWESPLKFAAQLADNLCDAARDVAEPVVVDAQALRTMLWEAHAASTGGPAHAHLPKLPCPRCPAVLAGVKNARAASARVRAALELWLKDNPAP